MQSLSYCLNVHPGQSLASIYNSIKSYALAVKAQIAPNSAFPLGLRLAAEAAQELISKPAEIGEFADFLSKSGLYVTEINGFPYGVFHSSPVKTAVYEPDWSTPERLQYTRNIATVLAACLPEGGKGSISTVPLGYGVNKQQGVANSCFGNAQTHERYISNVVAAAGHMAHIYAETGRKIVLALEPEPDCWLENLSDTLHWYEDELFIKGVQRLVRQNGLTKERAEAMLRQFVGICLDTCHFSVAFEDPLEVIRALESTGICIARVQISAAIRTRITPDSLKHLADFADPVYLHQTRIQTDNNKLLAFPDLDNSVLNAAGEYPGCQLRTHFHVPLYFDGNGELFSTNIDLTPEFFATVVKGAYPLEIETYTYGVLPPELAGFGVVDNLVREYNWVLEKITKCQTS